MRASFDQMLKVAAGFMLLCSFGACVAGTTNVPAMGTRSTQAEIVSINRINKSDRLTPALIQQAQQRLLPLAGGAKTSLQRPLLGCDPAFSPVADPARAGIYKRCTV